MQLPATPAKTPIAGLRLDGLFFGVLSLPLLEAAFIDPTKPPE